MPTTATGLINKKQQPTNNVKGGGWGRCCGCLLKKLTSNNGELLIKNNILTNEFWPFPVICFHKTLRLRFKDIRISMITSAGLSSSLQMRFTVDNTDTYTPIGASVHQTYKISNSSKILDNTKTRKNINRGSIVLHEILTLRA